MKTYSIENPAASRVFIVRDGRPLGGRALAARQREGEEVMVSVRLDPQEPHGPHELLTLPGSQVWVDTAWQAKWVAAERRYSEAMVAKRAAEEAREQCVCGHTRRAHHVGGVDDGGCTGCECPGYRDELAALRATLGSVETLIEVERRHLETHHGDHAAGDNYEDCSACRWHQVRDGILDVLGKGTAAPGGGT